MYYFGNLLTGADPATFVNLSDGYCKDRTHVWYLGDPVAQADAETFTVDNDGNARDKLGTFYHGERDSTSATAP